MDRELPTSSFRQRLASFGIDLFCIAGLQMTVGSLVLWLYRFACQQYGVSHDTDIELFLSQFYSAFFFIGYFTVSVGLFGNTVGKKVVGLKLIKEKTGEVLTMKDAYWRSMGYLMSSWTYMIGFILPLFREDKLALHDLLCGTRVVQQDTSGERSGQQLELPLLATVHPMRTRTKSQDPELGRTGTDR